MIFKSAVGNWFYLAMVLMVTAAVAAFVLPFINDPSEPITWFAVVIMLLALGLPFWMMVVTDYQIADGLLRIRSGPFRWTLPIDAITSVEPSNSPRSAPALSIDRLRICYDNDRIILVSPKDKAGFLQALGIHNTCD